MNILITLPKDLLEKIISGEKKFEMRKCLPKNMRIGEDGFFVVEKGSDEVRCWCRVDKAIETTGLTELTDIQLSSLSGGQLQRVMLARTIAQETPVILLDEPTNHLDLKHHIELISYLRDWSKHSTEVAGKTYPNTVISVFHDIGTAAILAENILLLKDGSIIKKGPAEEVLTRNLLNDIYDTDVIKYYEELSGRLSLFS